MVLINVAGTSTHYEPAELCVVSLSIAHEGENRSEVYDAITSTSNELSSSLKQLARSGVPGGEKPVNPPIAEWSMAKLSTSSWLPHHDQQAGAAKPERQYRVQTGFSITFKDFEKLGELCLDWSKTEYISIDNLDWQLTEATLASHQRNVRRGAMQDASTKAMDYASVLSKADTKPRLMCKEINDGVKDRQAPMHAKMMMRGGGRGGGGEAISFEPGKVEIVATVYCTFDYLLS